MTYSVAVTGAPAGNPQRPLSLTVDDTVAQVGGQAQACSLNTPFLCKGPDGQQAYYTYDAERTIPGVVRFLKKV